MQKKLLNVLNLFSGLCSLGIGVTLILELGFHFTLNTDLFTLIHKGFFTYLTIDIILRCFLKHRWRYFLTHPTDAFIFLPLLIRWSPEGSLWSHLLLSQIALVVILLGRVAHIHDLFKRLKLRPPQLLFVGFGLIIFTGSLLLTLPICTTTPLPFTDILFTSTSAVCVTGLSTVAVNTVFTRFGQLVIMILVQIGGLGIMAFSALFAMFLNRRFTHAESQIFQDNVATNNFKEALSIIRAIFQYTIVIELLGAVILFSAWHPLYERWEDALFIAVFHSVSAFCNAGFSLFENSLVPFQESPLILSTISMLIILGGLGFPVLYSIFRHNFKKYRFTRIKLQVKLILTTSLFLTVFGTLMLWAGEWNHSFTGMPWPKALLNAFFQSVTTRTAGFNSVEIGQFSMGSILVMISLMFIGASPGSTGGGIKTTTFGLLVLTFWNTLRAQPKHHMWGRSIPKETIFMALSMILLSMILVFSFLYLLLMVETTLPFKALLFEAVSAFATVGLSLGITAQLSFWGKAIIMILMLIGRVGPLTLGFALASAKPQQKVTYPEANIMIG